MKNLFRLLMAALVICATSCTKEDVSSTVVGEGEVIEVTFTAGLADLGTRVTTGSGTEVNKLYCNVFDATNGNELTELNTDATRGTDDKFTFRVVMVKGMTYDLVLWAECETADFDAYQIDGKEVTVTYNGVANDERYDAFCKFVEGFDPVTDNPAFTLTRPLAQLNAATNDKADVNASGIELTTSEVTISAFHSFNIAEGTASDKRDATFAAAVIPGGDLNGNAGYEYLAVNYLFVSGDSSLVDAKYTFKGTKADTSVVTFTGTDYSAIPLKPNHRTNILGALLTKPADFVVDINAGFTDPDEVVNVVTVANAGELQNAINNAPAGENTEIILDGDITLDDLLAGLLSTRAGEPQSLIIPADKVITLNIAGKLSHKNTIAGVNMIVNKGTLILGGGGTISYTYEGQPDSTYGKGNSTIENNGELIINDITVENATPKISHALYAINSNANGPDATLTINGGTIRNSGTTAIRVVTFSGGKNTFTLNGGTIEANRAIQLHLPSSASATLVPEVEMTFNDGVITSTDDVYNLALYLFSNGQSAANSTVVINGGTFNGNVALNGDFTTTAKQAGVTVNGGNFTSDYGVFSYSEDESAAANAISITGGTFKADPSALVAQGYSATENNGVWTVLQDLEANTVKSFIDAMKAGGNVTLQSDITLNDQISIVVEKETILNLNGYTLTGTAHKSVGAVIKNNSTLTINGGTISSTAANGGSAVANNGVLVVNDVTLNGAPNADGSWPSYTVNNIGTMTINDSDITSYHGSVCSYGEGAVITMNNTNIDMAGIPGFTSHGIYTYNSGKVVVNGGNITNKATDQNSTGASVINGAVEVNDGIFSGRIENYYGTPVLKGGTYSVNPAKYVAAGYQAVENGDGTWTVVVKGVKVNNAVELLAAVNQIADGDTITLSADFSFTTEEGGYYDNGGWKDGLGYSGDKSFTLDLNGHTLGNANGALNDYLIWFKNDGEKPNTITIKNGTLDAGTTAFCALCTSSSNKQTITVNLENVNLINNNSNGSTVKVRGGAVLNVKAGTKITGKNSYLGIECVASTTNIYDGAEIYMNGTSSYNGCLVGACGMGVVNVYGGYGKGVKGGFIAMTSGGTINVAGGEWIANTNGTIGDNSNVYALTAQNNKYESGYAGASIINVTGGTLRGGMDAWILNDVNIEKAELNISGGNFNANPQSYLTDGATATESNGIWTVTK